MTKFGVRLIASLFVLYAIFNLYGYITGTHTEQGFMGLSLGLTRNGTALDILGWIGVYVYLYAGYRLWHFDDRGRTWALIIFWTGVIEYILFTPLFLQSPGIIAEAHFHGSELIFPFNPVILSLLLGFVLIGASVIYFLMRKKTKELFQKSLAPEANISPIISQDSTHAQ